MTSMHRHDLDYTFVVIKPSQLEVFGENGDRLFDFWAEGTKAFKIKVSKFSIKTILYQRPSLGLLENTVVLLWTLRTRQSALASCKADLGCLPLSVLIPSDTFVLITCVYLCSLLTISTIPDCHHYYLMIINANSYPDFSTPTDLLDV